MNAKDYFKHDRFAATTGVELLEVKAGYAKGRLVIKDKHLNAGDTTQGGAIFTLADFIVGAASNSHGKLAFSLSGSVNFMKGSGPGDTLYAEARERFLHKRIACYQVDVTNQHGDLVATMEATVYRKDVPIDLTV
ncbi:MAG: hotdog fold thioesterase [Bacteroidota bacterium]|nr:hotdog fold thioesterase [Bacteroidota bacterium]